MAGLGCNTINELKNKLPALRNELKNENQFFDIYKFTFNFNKEGKHLNFDIAL